MPVLGWAELVVPGEDDLQISSLACVTGVTASKEDCWEDGLRREAARGCPFWTREEWTELGRGVMAATMAAEGGRGLWAVAEARKSGVPSRGGLLARLPCNQQNNKMLKLQ